MRRAGPLASAGYRSWVLGFVSGVNTMTANLKLDFLKGRDAEVLVTWIDDYCAAHPLDNLAGASIQLLTTLSPTQ